MRHLQRSVIRFFRHFLYFSPGICCVCACVANGVMGVVPATFWLWPVGRQKKNEKKRRYKLIKSLSSNRCWREGRKKERKERKRRKEAVYIARVMGAALGGEPVWWEPLLLQHNRHPLLLLLLFREIFSPFFSELSAPRSFFSSWAVLPVLPGAPSLLLLLLLPPT